MPVFETHTNLDGLNHKQREAVITEDKRVLVLAGAGSGKTRTLLQKLVYLVHDKGVKPSSILSITFTKNAANEMIDRLIFSADETGQYQRLVTDKKINQKEKEYLRFTHARKYRWIQNLTLKTFHSLCYGILRNFGVDEFDNQFRVISDKKLTDGTFGKNTAPETSFEVMHKILIEACDKPAFMLSLKRYILDYFIDNIHKNQHPVYSRAYSGRFFTTLKGDRVRSKSERDIADWLYRHNIKYEYEPEVNIKDFDFKPDFYVPHANMYIEHVSNKSYYLKDKEEQFNKAGKLFVKTYEAMTKDSALFNRAMERIVQGHLSDNYTGENALFFEEEFRTYHEEIRRFITQVLHTIDMVKVENLPMEEIYARAQKDQHERIRMFYQLALPLYKKYMAYCINKSYLDFNDMLIRALSLFDQRQEIRDKFQQRYKYILVDEFQDVNKLQVDLIQRLLLKNSQLFCVGDDWQSIYGFRGSEVNYIIHFRRYFENATIIKLHLNYRSTEHIVGASNEVIKNNKHKVDKDIVASKKSASKINIYAYQELEEGVNYLVQEIRCMMDRGFTNEDILVLYRRSRMFDPYRARLKQENLRVNGKTIHSSKGLEARAVFIIGLTEGYGGFPDIWLDDRIFQTIRQVKHDMLMEEERRLFYVALTRAKDELFLITEKGNESSFIDEIPGQYLINYQKAVAPMVEKVLMCDGCHGRLEAHFQFCPYCGRPWSS